MRKYPGQTDLSTSEREIKIRAVARRAAAEGMVLLENNGILPLRKNAVLALYGQGARYTVKGGTGSGDVNSRNTISVEQGLLSAGFRIANGDYLDRYDAEFTASKKRCEEAIYREAGEGRDPQKLYKAHATFRPEPPDLPILRKDAEGADAVVYVISRISGEFADRHAEKGDYYLSDREESDLKTLSGFGIPLIVVLNVGGIIDLSFLDSGKISALVLMSQAGSEGGSALADIFSGKVNPSGRLTDTWALRYEDYPSSATFSHRNGQLAEEFYTEGIYVGYRYFDSFGVKPRYPFGYGLSYTVFTSEICSAELSETGLSVSVKIRNAGSAAGRQAVQLYAACPSAGLETERKRLAAFGKTGLLQPGEEETLPLSFSLRALASYHERQAAWILQAGSYGILIGENAEKWSPVVRLHLDRTVVLEKTANICELQEAPAKAAG